MSNLDEKNIIENLQQFSEMPSERCWESIAQNLAPISPSPSNIDPSSATNQISQFFSTLAGKITAISTTAVVATSIGALYHFSNIEDYSETISDKIELVQNSENLNIDTTTTILPIEASLKSENYDSTAIKPKNAIAEVNSIENFESDKKNYDKTISEYSNQIDKEKTKESLPNNIVSEKSKSEKTTEHIIKSEYNSNIQKNKTEEIEYEPETINEQKNTSESQIVISNKIDKLDISDIVVPNVFTPNNDGYNDYFVFKNLEKYPNNRLIVVNSKGSKVYERNQYDNSWDAANVPDGSYFFILEISNDWLNASIQGVVQILR